jgi:DNA polymerase I-like protein with 3'-5' exonuclease and polymerase domains
MVSGIPVLMDPVEIARLLEHDEIIGFDTETTGLSPWANHLATMQLYGQSTGTMGLVQTWHGMVPEPIADLFKKNKLFIGHNVSAFDIPFLSTHGVEWRKSRWYDTLVGETVVTVRNRRNVSVSLRSSLKRRLGLVIDKNITHGHWDEEFLTPEQIQYACEDVISLPALYLSQLERAKETGQTKALAFEQEVMPCFAMMRINGLVANPQIIQKYHTDQTAKAEVVAAWLYEKLGRINLDSPAQLKRAITKACGWEIPNTSKDLLNDLRLGLHGNELLTTITDAVLKYREPRQRAKMYKDDWANKNVVNGRVHSNFWQCSTDTGRSSSSNPNLQQVPKDSRWIIGNVPGVSIVSADYSQIEVRIAAEIAHDATLTELLQETDVHTAIAAQMFQKPPAEVTADERRKAKGSTFALLYNGNATTLLRQSKDYGLNISYEECQDIEVKFFETFTGLNRIRQQANRMAARNGPIVIRLPNGFRRILVGTDKTASRILNTTVQGTAAIGLKMGLIEADKQGLVDTYIGAAVHDELVASVPTTYAENYAQELCQAMVVGMNRVVKSTVKAEYKVGDFWQA